MDSILKQRVLWRRYDLTGTVPEIMRELVDKCCIHPDGGEDSWKRIIPGLTLEDNPDISGLEKVHYVKTGCSLFEALDDLREQYGIDFAIGNNMQFWTRKMW